MTRSGNQGPETEGASNTAIRKIPCRRVFARIAVLSALLMVFSGVVPAQQQFPVMRPPTPAAPGQPARKAPTATDATVPDELAPGLKFKNTPLEMVLKDYAEKTHRTVLQAALPAVNVTLESQPNLTPDEYLEAIETVLAMNGVGLVKVGEKFIKVVPIAAARQEAMEITEKVEDVPLKENDALVSQMITLKNIDLKDAVAAITPLKHPYGQIHSFERSNSILITDAAATINRINQIIKYIDQPIEALEEPIIKEIRYAKAADIKSKLEAIIADAKKDAVKSTVPRARDSGAPGVVRPPTAAVPGVIRAAPPAPAASTPDLTQLMEDVERGIIRGNVKIIADDRTNILILITRPENMQFFDKIIKVLDVETAPDVIVKVIRLEYAEAEQLASTLNTLIGQVSKGPDVKSTTPVGEQKGESAALRDYVERLQKERDAAAAATSKEKEMSKVGELSATNIKILPDKRTNSLLIMASKADMATLEDMITSMDMALSQVMIEVVIFQITLENTYERGIDWVQRAMVAYDKKSGGGSSPKVAFAGVAGGATDRGSMQDPLGLRTLTSLSATGGNLTYYATFFNLNVDAIIKLIASDNRTKIMSSPTILTTDNKKATIDVTTEKYFFNGRTPVASANGTVQYVDNVLMRKVGTKLMVTPHINAKKNVVMEIDQNLEQSVGEQTINGANGPEAWPTIDASQLTAQVAVRSGETIVLGGLVSNAKVNNKSKVPLLGDIPLVGILFQHKKSDDTRKETVVFITPYVLDSAEEIQANARRRQETQIAPDPKDWPASSESRLAKDKMGAVKSKEKTPVAPAPAAVSTAVPDMDPELVEFIKRQDKKYGKALKNVDKGIDREMREQQSQE